MTNAHNQNIEVGTQVAFIEPGATLPTLSVGNVASIEGEEVVLVAGERFHMNHVVVTDQTYA